MFKKISDVLSQALFTLLALYLTFLLLRYPAQSLSYASTGLLLWFQRMIPTLLPFMILSGVMIRMNLTERFAKWFHPLFHQIWGTSLNGSYVLLMGILCGFPMGARVIGELLHAQKLSEKEASHLLAFCNNIGPIYFISFVMSTLSIENDYIPFCIMYGVPLVYGFFLYRFHYKSAFCKSTARIILHPASFSHNTAPSLLAAIDDSVISGLIGIGKLGGYMVFFNLLNILLYPFTSLSKPILGFCNCMLEITSGISTVGKEGFFMILILLPFGGFSCIAQTYSMIKDTNLSITHYFLHKCIQTILTATIYIFYAFFYAYNF
ncbi:MAG: hypothetical protein J6B68_08295 [Lachnospiraceae bacterium]|nr:hypothetical protein [Lachnospiraceae bacterium]